jgi:hypothetical protein
MENLDLLCNLYDFYTTNGYINIQWKSQNYKLNAEEGDIILMQQQTIVRRFSNIQEAITYLAEQNVQLLKKD